MCNQIAQSSVESNLFRYKLKVKVSHVLNIMVVPSPCALPVFSVKISNSFVIFPFVVILHGSCYLLAMMVAFSFLPLCDVPLCDATQLSQSSALNRAEGFD